MARGGVVMPMLQWSKVLIVLVSVSLLAAGPAAADAAPLAAAGVEATEPLAGVTDFAAGEWHSCAVTDAGGVMCWGFNNAGQLGDGTFSGRSIAAPVIGLDATVVSAEAGGGHTCAVTDAGGVKCWGYNSNGQLGDGTRTTRSTPVDVVGLASGVEKVVTGYHHTCALLDTGGVQCWGRNGVGQLGDGFGIDSRSPSDVSGLTAGVADVADVATGFDHTCAVTDTGAVQCWGLNDRGQLGDGTTTNRSTPVAVSGLASGAAGLTLGWFHSCAQTVGGGAQCWGNNNYGQLGNGTTTASLVPVAVTGLTSPLSAMSAGYWHTCGFTTSGGTLCWGLNQSGQVGDGTTQNRLEPVAVTGLSAGVSNLASGFEHSCVVASGAALCWGKNQFSQLGDGTTTDRWTPAAVLAETPPDPPTVLPGATTVDEGDDGTVVANVPVELSSPSLLPVTVDWVTLDHTATAPSDYAEGSGVVTFLPGETSATVPVTVNGDRMLEDDEIVLVSFRNPINAKMGGFWGLGFAVIANDDPPPVATPGFASTAEGDSGTSVLEIPIVLSAPSAFPVTVDWTTFDLTAVAPWDYRSASGTLIIEPGNTTGVAPVSIRGDRRREADEWLVVAFSNPNGATVGGSFGFGLGLIVNDDLRGRAS